MERQTAFSVTIPSTPSARAVLRTSFKTETLPDFPEFEVVGRWGKKSNGLSPLDIPKGLHLRVADCTLSSFPVDSLVQFDSQFDAFARIAGSGTLLTCHQGAE